MRCAQTKSHIVQVLNYFLSLDIKLTEVYGMSESSGIHTGNLPGKIKFGSVGVNSDVTVKSKLVKVRPPLGTRLVVLMSSNSIPRVATPR